MSKHLVKPPWWHPHHFTQHRQKRLLRAQIFAGLRAYFAAQGFVEVDTPALQISPGLDPHLSAFATDYVTPRADNHRLYLATSPEFTCKKLLVAGMEKIYQLAHVFRNAEGSSRHHPEFTLLEWYRVGAGYKELMADCEALLRLALRVGGKNECQYGGLLCDVTKPAMRLSVAEAFQKYAGFDVLATVDDAENPSPVALALQAKKMGMHTASDDRWDDLALRILAEKIEPHLGVGAPCFLYDYPLCMAALSRPSPDNPALAQRFELYVCGLELANAFVELTDPTVQRKRFEADRALQQQRYGRAYPLDEDFLAALQHGMPDAAGIALGVDRLVMLATGASRIAEVLWAPVAHTGEDESISRLGLHESE